MPYIAVSTSRQLSQQEKGKLASALGENIGIIPGKKEDHLMVDISDSRDIFYAGKAGDWAFVEIRCYGPTAAEAQQAYAKAVFDILEKQLGLKGGQVYLNHVDLMAWGAAGALKNL